MAVASPVTTANDCWPVVIFSAGVFFSYTWRLKKGKLWHPLSNKAVRQSDYEISLLNSESWINCCSVLVFYICISIKEKKILRLTFWMGKFQMAEAFCFLRMHKHSRGEDFESPFLDKHVQTSLLFNQRAGLFDK